MLKKIILGTTIGILSIGNSFASSQKNEDLYITIQKNLNSKSESNWVLSSVSNKKPTNVMVGQEEVLKISGNSVSPVFSKKIDVIYNGKGVFKCDFSQKAVYSPCSSSLTNQVYTPVSDLNKIKQNLVEINKKKVQELLLETHAIEKIKEYHKALEELKNLLILQDTLWVEILDEMSSVWEEFEKSRNKFKQKLSINDKTNLFNKKLADSIPRLYQFTDELSLPEKPDFLKPSFLNRVDPSKHFYLDGHLKAMAHLENAMIGKAKIFKDKILSKMAKDLTMIHLKTNDVKYNGWQMEVDGPSEVPRLSSNKTIPLNVTIIGKDTANLLPPLEMHDGIIKVSLSDNGDIVFENTVDEPIAVKKLMIKLNGQHHDIDLDLTLSPGSKIGFNLFDKGYLPKKVYLNLDNKKASLIKFDLELKIKYNFEGGDQYIFEETTGLLSNIIRNEHK